VMMVKHWARCKGLVNSGRSLFPWTLMAVFFLQRNGTLPDLRRLCTDGNRCYCKVAMAPPHELLSAFAGVVLDLVENSRHGHRRWISLWTGSLLARLSKSSRSSSCCSSNIIEGHASLIDAELRCLRAAFKSSSQVSAGRSAGAVGAPMSHALSTPPSRRTAFRTLPPIQEATSPVDGNIDGATQVAHYPEVPPFPNATMQEQEPTSKLEELSDDLSTKMDASATVKLPHSCTIS